MIATHVLAVRTADGEVALAHELAAGRASALFALLAGVSIALTTGRARPPVGRDRLAASVSLVVRALVIGLVGLLLGSLDTGIAVILSYYAVLFVLVVPFLGLGPRALLVLGGSWIVVGPVLSWLVRPLLPPRGFASPHLAQLAEPGQLLSELLFTGYYPAVPWLAYLLVGLALGRCDLRNPRLVLVATWAGGVLALAAVGISHALTRRSTLLAPELDRIETGMYGQTPVDGPWQWLLVVAPHSSTPFDLAHTLGSAVAVTGLCLLLVRLLPRAGVRAVAVLSGAGTMTLTLYSLHVVMRTPHVWPPERPDTFWWHVGVVLLLGALGVALGRRGPLEVATGTLSRGAGRPFGRPRGSSAVVADPPAQ